MQTAAVLAGFALAALALRSRRRRTAAWEGLVDGLWVRDSGGSGTPLLLLHGMMLDGTSFAAQEAALAPAGARVITMDMRGVGRSAPAPAGAVFGVDDLAQDALAVLRARRVRRAVVGGTSLGGFVAMRLALAAPEAVAGLVLMSTRLGGTGPEVQQMVAAWAASTSTSTETESDGGDSTGEQLARAVCKRIFNEEVEEWVRAWTPERRRRMVPLGAALAAYDGVSAADAARLAAPAIVVYGAADAGIAEPKALELAAALRDCRAVVRVEGGSHAVNTTHAEEVNVAIEAFLSGFS